jgi:hypothetical protein
MAYIVSDKHKFVYISVPKVACTSLKTTLLPLFELDNTAHRVTRNGGATGFRVHELFAKSRYQISKEQFMSRLDDRYQEYFKFAFVRNPWDRLVSCYFNKLVDVKETDLGKPALRSRGKKDSKLYKGMPFAEFVETVHGIPDNEANSHFVSQYEIICGPGRDELIMADFVGRFENLAADFDAVAERIGSAQKLQLPHLHRFGSRKSRSYTDLYDERLKNLVHERYQEDIEIFGYSFGDSCGMSPLRGRGHGQAASRRLEQDEDMLGELNPNLGGHAERLAKRKRNLERKLKNIHSSNSLRLLNKINRLRKRLSPPFKRK